LDHDAIVLVGKPCLVLQIDIQPACMIDGEVGDRSMYHGSWMIPTIFFKTGLPNTTLHLAMKNPLRSQIINSGGITCGYGYGAQL